MQKKSVVFTDIKNLVSTLPRVPIRKGAYVGAVALRKDLSKRLRSLGLNEVKTYTLTSPTMASKFRYETKEQIVLPNPMSVDKSVIRTSILPSLLTVYEYNKARKVSDVMIYEIANTYDKNREEDAKVAILMKGNYIQNSWSTTGMKTDFYLMKGIMRKRFKLFRIPKSLYIPAKRNCRPSSRYQCGSIAR